MIRNKNEEIFFGLSYLRMSLFRNEESIKIRVISKNEKIRLDYCMFFHEVLYSKCCFVSFPESYCYLKRTVLVFLLAVILGFFN